MGRCLGPTGRSWRGELVGTVSRRRRSQGHRASWVRQARVVFTVPMGMVAFPQEGETANQVREANLDLGFRLNPATGVGL